MIKAVLLFSIKCLYHKANYLVHNLYVLSLNQQALFWGDSATNIESKKRPRIGYTWSFLVNDLNNVANSQRSSSSI